MLTCLNLPLKETAQALRSGSLDLLEYINQTCDFLEEIDLQLLAFLPFPQRREYLLKEAAKLQERYPDKAERPPLYGVLIGVKDLMHADGFPTGAGSALPPEVLTGPEGEFVKTLRKAGALILGKTVTAELAFFEPGPTRNPHNLNHTPGGSSSGSAAAVAVGICPLAIGTQTGGSIIRPAAFCGIIGFKPSYGRIPTDGYMSCAPSLDHFGLFTQDIAGIELAASVACQNWQTLKAAGLNRPVLGVPDGPYLAQVEPEALAAFEEQLERLQQASYIVKRVEALRDVEAINKRQRRLVVAELGPSQAHLFAQYSHLYRPMTAEAIREGVTVSAEELALHRAALPKLRADLENLMKQNGLDLWVSPAAVGPAPEGISTGNPAPNAPWPQAGLPTLALPAGLATNGLPLGLQFAAHFGADEQLLAWAEELNQALAYHAQVQAASIG